MRPDYKNWMPKWMVTATSFVGMVFAIVGLGFNVYSKKKKDKRFEVLGQILSVIAMLIQIVALWIKQMYDAFSYTGERQLAREVIDGVAEYVNIPEGGKGLDIGCGSGALAIACAKRNPKAMMIGIDRWGKEYASYSRTLCEENAEAEGVYNVSFRKGDALRIGFPDETFDVVTSNYVYHNIPDANKQELLRETLRVLKKGGTFAIHDIMSPGRYGDMQAFCEELRAEGYEEVKLIPTTNGMFMSRFEALWMFLRGSALLVGKK